MKCVGDGDFLYYLYCFCLRLFKLKFKKKEIYNHKVILYLGFYYFTTFYPHFYHGTIVTNYKFQVLQLRKDDDTLFNPFIDTGLLTEQLEYMASYCQVIIFCVSRFPYLSYSSVSLSISLCLCLCQSVSVSFSLFLSISFTVFFPLLLYPPLLTFPLILSYRMLHEFLQTLGTDF